MTALACLHGFTGDASAWDAVLAGLPTGLEAVCPPMTGHTRQQFSPSQGFVQEVDRLAGELERHAEVGLHLAGYSMGARLALGLLVRHQSLFASATLIGVHPGLATEEECCHRRAADDKLARLLDERGLEVFIDHWQQVPLFRSQQTLPRSVLKAQRERRLAHSADGLAHALRTLSLGNMPNFNPKLPDLELPIHLMVGAHDDKFRRLAESMIGVLPRATLEVVPAAGHNLLLEAPGVVATAIRRACCDGTW